MSNSSERSSRAREPVVVRDLRKADRAGLVEILQAVGNFSDEEIAVALELIDHGIHGTDPDYRFVVAERAGGRVAGYACYGPTPLTEGVHDLYWIAVDPTLQGSGVGRKLMDAVESTLTREGARMILIETASKPSYDATRAFYVRIGYDELARLPDFYRPGDDKVIYGRRL